MKKNAYPNTKEWDENQRNELYQESLGRIKNLINGYYILDPALDKKDLMQEASMAFFKAYDLYDPTRGVQFQTFAYRLMQNAINELMRRGQAAKRKPAQPTISYDSAVTGDGDDLMGADNMDIPESSTFRPNAPVDEFCANREAIEYIYQLLDEVFTPVEKNIFLSLSQGLKTQIELAKEIGCSQAKISMMYTFVRVRLRYELEQAGFDN